MEKVECLIIGSGPAGYTAAIYAARADMKPVVYEGLQPGGQLTITTDVENYPGYPDGIMGPEMMENFKKQAVRLGADVRFGMITSVEFDRNGGTHKVTVDESTEIECETVIISTGASAKWLNLPSEQRLNGSGVSACAVCDGFFYRGEDVAIVGAGDTAAEEASYLAKICKKVYMLVRKDEMRASKAMQHRVNSLPNVEILYNTETDEVLGDMAVEAVRVFNNVTGEKKEIAIKGFFVAIGHKPNTDIFKEYLKMDEAGYIITYPDSTKTDIPGVFVCGDAQDKIYRQAVTAAGSGCMAALDAERYLSMRGVEA
ncbi:MAG: thioredoxin-disulfide reductase [Bacteroidota bacterium]|jgi:thioredoxin reductase (NADPH)